MGISKLLIKQLFDQSSGTFSYLLIDELSREGLFIDTVYEKHERDLALVRELKVSLLACIETHCHADHVTGAWLMQHATGCEMFASENSQIENLNRSLQNADAIIFGEHHLIVLATPGHTDGCISLVMDDQSCVFTGDTLLIRGCGRTDFQQGSASRLFHSITGKLFTLPDTCIVYPAHDYEGRTASSIGEEKELNPRIGGRANENDFVGYMDNMQLPHPKQLDIAVPANLKAGRPQDESIPCQPDWAPVITTYGGILKISPRWVAGHLDEVTVLDVRPLHELAEEPARIAGAQLIPISELKNRMGEVKSDKPVMTLCRSGKRSVLAFKMLKEYGIHKVANIDGGLLQWIDDGLPVEQTN